MSRFDDRRVLINDADLYKEYMTKKGVNFIRQYTTAELEYPTDRQMQELAVERHVWGVGDKYFKLAYEHYGDSELWWIIAWFNKKPTEVHVKAGDVILIPKPLSTINKFLKSK